LRGVEARFRVGGCFVADARRCPALRCFRPSRGRSEGWRALRWRVYAVCPSAAMWCGVTVPRPLPFLRSGPDRTCGLRHQRGRGSPLRCEPNELSDMQAGVYGVRSERDTWGVTATQRPRRSTPLCHRRRTGRMRVGRTTAGVSHALCSASAHVIVYSRTMQLQTSLRPHCP